jgi:hypothetical protein
MMETKISSTSGGRSVGIVRSRTKGHGVCFVCLMMETIHSSETSVLKRATWRHFPEEAFFIVTAVKISNLTPH